MGLKPPSRKHPHLGSRSSVKNSLTRIGAYPAPEIEVRQAKKTNVVTHGEMHMLEKKGPYYFSQIFTHTHKRTMLTLFKKSKLTNDDFEDVF